MNIEQRISNDEVKARNQHFNIHYSLLIIRYSMKAELTYEYRTRNK